MGYADGASVAMDNTGEDVGAGAEQRSAAVLMLASVFPLWSISGPLVILQGPSRQEPKTVTCS